MVTRLPDCLADSYRLDKRCLPCGTPIPAWLLGTLAAVAFIGISLIADRILSQVKNLAQILAPILILLTFFRTLPVALRCISQLSRLSRLINFT